LRYLLAIRSGLNVDCNRPGNLMYFRYYDNMFSTKAICLFKIYILSNKHTYNLLQWLKLSWLKVERFWAIYYNLRQNSLYVHRLDRKQCNSALNKYMSSLKRKLSYKVDERHHLLVIRSEWNVDCNRPGH